MNTINIIKAQNSITKAMEILNVEKQGAINDDEKKRIQSVINRLCEAMGETGNCLIAE